MGVGAVRRGLLAAVLHRQPSRSPGVAASYATSSYGGGAQAGSIPGPVPTLPPPIGPSPAPAPKPKAAGPVIAGPQDRWALLVGITNYRAPVHHTTAGAQDAVVTRDLLLKSGWRSDHIRLLTDGRPRAGRWPTG